MILVTGGTGLVGSHLLFELVSNTKKVKAIYRSEKSLNSVKKIFSYFTDDVGKFFDNIEWVQADVTDVPSLVNAFKDVTIVYHAAALVSFDDKEYRKMRQVNIEGTANVVNLCISSQVKKLCFVSSIAAIGDSINNEIVTEENEWSVQNDNNGYSITKHGAEMEIWRASQEGVDVVIVNPGVILGAGFWNKNTGQFFTKVAKGFNYFTTGVTGFVGVKDVVKSMILLTESKIKNERYILVSENKSFQEIFTKIADALHREPPSIKVPKVIISMLSGMDACFSLIRNKPRMLTKNSAKSLYNKTHYSSEKIKKEMHLRFSLIDDVIEETGMYYNKDH